MIESRAAYDADAISQGDIFEWSTPTHGCTFGIIVTADCDIAYNKYGSYLTYVPVWSLDSYVATHYMPGRLLKASENTLQQIEAMIWRLQQKHRPEFSQRMSSDAVVRWLNSVDASEISRVLSAEPAESESLEGMIVQWSSLEGIANESDPATQIRALAQANKCSNAKVHKQIHEHVSRLPGDRMYLSSIDGVSEIGHVVLLRALREIDVGAIALNAIQERNRPAKRIARLESPYRYRLTQMLGEVFSSIGLPDQYELGRTEVLEQAYDLAGGK